MHPVLVGSLVIFSCGLLSFLLPRGMKAAVAVLGAATGGLLAASAGIAELASGGAAAVSMDFPYPFKTVVFELDPLSALFVALIGFVGAAAAVYGFHYLGRYDEAACLKSTHYGFVNILIAAMLWVVTARHALFFLTAWELMSLSSFVLVLFESREEEPLKAGLYYLVAMHVGVVLLTAAFIIASLGGGSYDLADMAGYYRQAGGMPAGLIFLFMAGFAFKAGFVPLHSWLPLAHPAAPSNVSALMSGVMIKTGIYGMLRLLLVGGMPPRGLIYLLLAVSVLTALYGIGYALIQRDYKKLLAYSSIENIGLIGIGISAGLLGASFGNPVMLFLGFTGALMHLVHHSLIKSLLFFGAGEVYAAAHSRDMERLGGLAKRMPRTAACTLAGAAGIAALPPFAGFAGEFFMYLAFLAGTQSEEKMLVGLAVVLFAVLAAVGAMAVVAFAGFFGTVFLGTPRSVIHSEAKPDGWGALAPMALLAGLVLVLGLLPRLVLVLVLPAAAQLVAGLGLGLRIQDAGKIMDSSIGLTMNVTAAFGAFAALAGLLAAARGLARAKNGVRRCKTWDCGYQAGTPRMQYGYSSFTAPLVHLLEPVLRRRELLDKPEGLFPLTASYDRREGDSIDDGLIRPLSRRFGRMLGRLAWIQSGETRQYILYGLVFLMVAILWIIGAPA